MFSSIKSGLGELEAEPLMGEPHVWWIPMNYTQSFLFSHKETDFQEMKCQ